MASSSPLKVLDHLNRRLNGPSISKDRSKAEATRRRQLQVYNFLLRPHYGPLSFLYHFTVGTVIVLALFFFALTTIPEHQARSYLALRILEILFLFIQLVEYLLLLWASSHNAKYRKLLGKIRFIFAPFRLVNLLMIGITATVIWTCWLPDSQAHLRWINCIMIFQMLRLETRFKPWRFFRFAFRVQRKHLLPSALIVFSFILTNAFVVYFIERTDPQSPFSNIPLSLYWSLITVCTIGYGDVTPTTTAGRIVVSLLSMAGIIAYAIPPGILSTGLALRTYEQNRLKTDCQRRAAAASLLQSAWRCFIAAHICQTRTRIRWRRSLQIATLTRMENAANNGAVLFVNLLKFALARGRFKAARKPYDVQDVLQRYSEGHADVVGLVRSMHTELDGMFVELEGQLQSMLQTQCRQRQQIDRLEKTVLLLEQLAGSGQCRGS